jgi:predicted ester cyclase
MVNSIYTAFPDLQATIEEMIAEGDKVVVRWAWQGTHQGEWQGIAPTGKQFKNEGITIYTLANGRIVDDRFQANGLGLMQQLGAIPASGDGGE